jgi:hypothetical protein
MCVVVLTPSVANMEMEERNIRDRNKIAAAYDSVEGALCLLQRGLIVTYEEGARLSAVLTC